MKNRHYDVLTYISKMLRCLISIQCPERFSLTIGLLFSHCFKIIGGGGHDDDDDKCTIGILQ